MSQCLIRGSHKHRRRKKSQIPSQTHWEKEIIKENNTQEHSENIRERERELKGDGRSLNGLIKMSFCFCIEINQTDSNGPTEKK